MKNVLKLIKKILLLKGLSLTQWILLIFVVFLGVLYLYSVLTGKGDLKEAISQLYKAVISMSGVGSDVIPVNLQ